MEILNQYVSFIKISLHYLFSIKIAILINISICKTPELVPYRPYTNAMSNEFKFYLQHGPYKGMLNYAWQWQRNKSELIQWWVHYQY